MLENQPRLGYRVHRDWIMVPVLGVLMSEQGERGDSGERGIAGERGPKGDHGQHGDKGRTGKVGPTGHAGDTGATGKNAPRRGLIGYFILTGFVFLALFSSYRTDQHLSQNAKENCAAATQNRMALRAIFIDANRRTQTSKQRTPKEKKEAQEFYDNALALLPPIKCETEEQVSLKFN